MYSYEHQNYGYTVLMMRASLCKLDTCQTACLCQIFGESSWPSIKMMLHLVNQPSIRELTSILQTQFLFRSIHLLPGSQKHHFDILVLLLLTIWRFECSKASIRHFSRVISSLVVMATNSKLLTASRSMLTIDRII
ncbi:MAG: hypothetical protein EXX96DRAFT_606767 [Benjaminiella poitrasii]|nr:MAG: hypothetical protein EXX96DRAFT_606767 [Benjaminiella poitrasii]